MTQIHTCYTTSIALKKFLHNSCPEPLDKCYWINEHGDIRSVYKEEVQEWYIPIFCLHDLLSKPFCEAFIRERFARRLNYEAAAWELSGYLERMINEYYNGGLPAVEKALLEMMEAK
jgi:hypothetical protein